jgi:hypothetical protein
LLSLLPAAVLTTLLETLHRQYEHQNYLIEELKHLSQQSDQQTANLETLNLQLPSHSKDLVTVHDLADQKQNQGYFQYVEMDVFVLTRQELQFRQLEPVKPSKDQLKPKQEVQLGKAVVLHGQDHHNVEIVPD